MLVELIEDEQRPKKSDPAEFENLALGYSKFNPFSTNHPKFSDDCLCRKCKWNPKYRSKRILESNFIEILGVPKEKPSQKSSSYSDSLLDNSLGDAIQKIVEDGTEKIKMPPSKKRFEKDPLLIEPLNPESINDNVRPQSTSKVDEEIIILPNKTFL